MIVEDQIEDKLPFSLRVLAVDDDPICLKVLETLLRKCQYQVTTTNQAVTALKLLRENKSKYDLVISDVNMPDMDGFKLLELVGLEMDLPVIMVSAHGDKELVYKGVTHGAVDYLLKPVRVEELKNIWQHVIRKKKLGPKDQSRSSDQDKPREEITEGGQGGGSTGSVDQNGRSNRRKKDHDGEEEEGGEENGHENDEQGNQKKPRVVWSVELHRKFVAAVNQLGLDKAVPKKILDLMNVEGLSRENVASHLQKYRLYLKRISNAASQQANMVAAFGSKDSAYLRMGSLDGFGDFRTIVGPGRISSASLSSYAPSSVLGRLNSPAGLTLHGIASSGILNSGHSQTLSHSVNNHGTLQPSLLPANQTTNLFQGTPSELESNHFLGRSTSCIAEFNHSDDTKGFSHVTGFSDARVNISSMGNAIPTSSGNSSMLQTSMQQRYSRGAFTGMPSSNHDSFDASGRGSSSFLDHNTCGVNLAGSAQLSKFPSNSLQLSEPFGRDALPTNHTRDSVLTGSHINNSSICFSSSSGLSAPLETPRADVEGQAGLIGGINPNTGYTSNQRWEHGQNYSSGIHSCFDTINPLGSANGSISSSGQSMDQAKRFNEPLLGQLNHGAPSVFQHTDVDNNKMRSNDNFLMELGRPQNSFVQNNLESLDEMMNAMIKREQSEAASMEGDFGFDAYTLGSCI